VGSSLFPDEDTEILRTTRVERGEIEGLWAAFQMPPSAPEDGKTIPLLLIGCVRYDYGVSSEAHQTNFGYDVVRPDGKVILGAPITEKIALMRSPLNLQNAN
jgi:hypothetical protein